MKMSLIKMFASSVLLATLVSTGAVNAQALDNRDLSNAPGHWASDTANDSWESGVAGSSVRVQPDDAIEDGRVVGKDPDRNIRTQLQREYHDGGDGS